MELGSSILQGSYKSTLAKQLENPKNHGCYFVLSIGKLYMLTI